MCIGVNYMILDYYFGCNLDLEFLYNEVVMVMLRNFFFWFWWVEFLFMYYVIIGMVMILDGYFLYYDVMNEKGFSMVGFNFFGNVDYKLEVLDKINIMLFEFIFWIFGQFEIVDEVKVELEWINFVDIFFSDVFLLLLLYWIIFDWMMLIIVESVVEGLKVYDNLIGVFINNFIFDIQVFIFNNFMYLLMNLLQNNFFDVFEFDVYSCGMGVIGLLGDLLLVLWFVKVVFMKMNFVFGDFELEFISQFFQIFGFVVQQCGCVVVFFGKFEIIIYFLCCNIDKGIYYYIIYENSQVMVVDMYKEDFDGSVLVDYFFIKGQQIYWQN